MTDVATPQRVKPIAEVSLEDLRSDCFHCGLPVPEGEHFSLTLNNICQPFCCGGCQAVASMIHEGGLGQFYQFRSQNNQKANARNDDYTLFDRAEMQEGFVTQDDETFPEQKTAYLLLDGISCAACVWLIEKYLGDVNGVVKVTVNASTHQCIVVWDKRIQSLSFLMQSLDSIGYRPQAYTQKNQQESQQKKQRLMLMRLGLAGFGMMQVGMVAVALYAGDMQGIDSEWVSLLRWLSLLVATPIVLFSAQPFWSAAIRNLKQRHLTMDVPVSLAIVLAYLASVWATITHTGEVYFDSVSMFTFFLLLGRFLEMRLRHRNQLLTGNATELLPYTVNRLEPDNAVVVIPILQLATHDIVKVYAGDTIPCDGVVKAGQSKVSEAVLTGESNPVGKALGDTVVAGTSNLQDTLEIQATAVGQRTRLSTITRLVQQAEQEKPKIQMLADRVASYFVAAILTISVCVYTVWYFIEPTSALWITLSVLVVTCPCALSLATPAALTAAVTSMRRQGLLIFKGHVIESLARITQVIFDKTGTLTIGQPSVVEVVMLEKGVEEEKILAIVASLEANSNHPIAHAFKSYKKLVGVRAIKTVSSQGVMGVIDGHEWRFGQPIFALSVASGLPAPVRNMPEMPKSQRQWILLSRDGIALAWVGLNDPLRAQSSDAVTGLHAAGLQATILSGDGYSMVSVVAQQLGIPDFLFGQSPEQKLDVIKQYQQQHRVLMVGDGINDVPVLAGADVSVAMDTAADFTRTSADSVLLNNNLAVLPNMIALAKTTQRIIKQNLGWALGYNLLALPLAAMGYIPPYLAAIGMSLSSLIVVLNALRLHRL